MESFLEIKINNTRSNMSSRERDISDWCIKTKPNFTKMSITKFATKVGVSPSTINRWCFKLGFDGYKHFHSTIILKEKFDHGYEGLISTTSKDSMFSISSTESSFNYEDLILTVDKIQEYKEIVFYGTSFSFLQCEYFARMFKKINIKSSVLNIGSDLEIIMPNKKAVHIFLSMSGKNNSVLRAFNKLTEFQKDQFIVSISANKISNISNKANTELHGTFYQSVEIDLYELPIVAKTVTEYILFQLFIHVYMRDKEIYSKLIKNITRGFLSGK